MLKNTLLARPSYWAMASMMAGIGFASSAMAADTVPAKKQAKAELPTVVVEGTQVGDYNVTEPSLYKMTAPLKDTPKSVTAISREVMDDQGVTTMRDTLRNVPGLSLAAGEGGSQGDSVTIRGFSARSDFFLDGTRDFGSYYRDPFNLEEVQVLQGPASILFGRGSTGGIIEQESKQAFLGSFNESTLMLGSNATRRATTDLNTAIPDLEGAAFRVNVMGQTNEFSERNVAENRRFGIAPSLALGLGTETRLNLNYFHQGEDDTPDYGHPWLGSSPAKVNRENYYGFTDDFIKADADIGTARIEHDLNDTTMLRDQFRSARYHRDVRITEPQINSPFTPASPLNTIDVTRNQLTSVSTETYLGNQLDLTKQFETGGLKHDLITGIELSHEISNPKRPNTTGVPTANLLNPNEHELFSGIATPSSNTDASADTAAFYAVDTFHVHKMLDLIGGWRFDRIKGETTQFLPAVTHFERTDNLSSWQGAVVFKPQENGSIYFDYGTSFNPSVEQLSLGSTVSSSGKVSANSATVGPEESTTYELGTKWELLKKKLSTSFALFRSEKTNARETDPTNALLYVLSGEQRSQGFVAQASGYLTDRWEVIAGYGFQDTEITASVIPGATGNHLANAPQNTFNLFTTYRLPTAGKFLPNDLEVGGGMNVVSSRYANSSVSSTRPFLEKVDGYTTFDLMAKYPITQKVDIQLNVFNLTNEFFYDQLHPSHVVPGEGRTIMLSTSFSF